MWLYKTEYCYWNMAVLSICTIFLKSTVMHCQLQTYFEMHYTVTDIVDDCVEGF